MKNEMLKENKEAWDSMADDWFGTTALPTYGVLAPTESDLHLFGNIQGQKVLDIGCGSGHSLKYMGDHGAAELWGLDLSTKQIENAGNFLQANHYLPKLFVSPMEENPGIPMCYFDVVYSIYAIGWTVDLEKTFSLISSYLKKNGIFVFSWDHPFMHCVDIVDDKLIFSGSYHEKERFQFEKGGKPVSLYNRRLCDYINTLSKTGFTVEELVEETDKDTLAREGVFRSAYYSPVKARKFPLSFIIKARKL